MIEQVADERSIDKHRIFITGLSAGGAMTSVMLAAYPELFAAGAVIAGLPYGIATNLQEALSGMFHTGHRSAPELGNFIRNASSYNGQWPRVSVWHGSSDRTVNPRNADYIVSQWLDVHGLPAQPMSEDAVDGYPHQVWRDSNGKTVVESFTITGMAHGTPLGLAENDERYGVEGAFLLEAGISSSYHIAKFFGLTEPIHKMKATGVEIDRQRLPLRLQNKPVTHAAGGILNISATINDALKAAGLIR
jgi:poly(3-hydroxybutyrate) depolymerase